MITAAKVRGGFKLQIGVNIAILGQLVKYRRLLIRLTRSFDENPPRIVIVGNHIQDIDSRRGGGRSYPFLNGKGIFSLEFSI